MFGRRLLIVFLIIEFPIFFISILLLSSGVVSLSYNGFGVDSNNVLYIGKSNLIEKYSNGELIGEIDPQTSRAYAFTLKKDDTIMLSTGSTIYTMDLDGKVLKTQEDELTLTFNNLKQIKEHTSSNGKTYHLKSFLGKESIISNDGKIIFTTPLLDYVIKLVFFSCIISTIVVVPIILCTWNKKT